jgi:hypothetical protein
MDAVGARGQSDVHPVIDDKQGVVPTGLAAGFAGKGEKVRSR